MDRASRPEGAPADVEGGWEVNSADERHVGTVRETAGDHVVVRSDLFTRQDRTIPRSAIRRIEHDRVYLNITKDEVEGQGWDTEPVATPGGARSGLGTTGAARQRAGAPTRTGDGEQTLHLHEEELRVAEERTQAGEVRVGKEVVGEQQTIDVPVTREEVFIEWTPGDRQPDDHGIGEGAGETIRVPISEERVEVEKVPVMTEEVRVGKREVTENRQVTDTVRREEARIENEGDVRVEGGEGTPRPGQGTPRPPGSAR